MDTAGLALNRSAPCGHFLTAVVIALRAVAGDRMRWTGRNGSHARRGRAAVAGAQRVALHDRREGPHSLGLDRRPPGMRSDGRSWPRKRLIMPDTDRKSTRL